MILRLKRAAMPPNSARRAALASLDDCVHLRRRLKSKRQEFGAKREGLNRDCKASVLEFDFWGLLDFSPKQ